VQQTKPIACEVKVEREQTEFSLGRRWGGLIGTKSGTHAVWKSPMKRTIITVILASNLFGTIADAEPKYGPGVTDTEIKLGQTGAYSGDASQIGIPTTRAMQALIMRVNKEGGINGRRIKLLSLDDAYSPPKTVEQTRRLVESDEVLAITGSLGSAPNAAIEKYLNVMKVPQIFLLSGSARFLAPKEFPWTLPFPLSAERIGEAYGRFIKQTKPDAKVAILYQNDEFGRQGEKAIRQGLGEQADKFIVAERSFDVGDPTVDSQIVGLKASGADVLFHESIPKFAAQGLRKVYELGWRPLQFVDVPAASIASTFFPVGLNKAVGVVSATYFKDLKDPTWKSDIDVKVYFETLNTFAPEIDPYDSNSEFGYSVGESIVAVLRQCGDDLTRENVMRQATNLKQIYLSLLLPGITLNTTSEDYAAIKQLRLMQFDGTAWNPIGDLMMMP
jgi:branched-chain amino acid transport system substrate-binding protein